ncbi:MAG: SHOCT domain-containing protein [Actinobacteria bacterium]|nr:SHOCT domain-containing protein [Actinomycetota bacterium]
MRAGRSDMTKRRFLGGGGPNVSREDMARLNRRYPAQTFTGNRDHNLGAVRSEEQPGATPAPAAEAPGPNGAAGAPAGDLVAQLERLRALRDDGTLTEEEFAAAKAQLLGRG